MELHIEASELLRCHVLQPRAITLKNTNYPNDRMQNLPWQRGQVDAVATDVRYRRQ